MQLHFFHGFRVHLFDNKALLAILARAALDDHLVVLWRLDLPVLLGTLRGEVIQCMHSHAAISMPEHFVVLIRVDLVEFQIYLVWGFHL